MKSTIYFESHKKNAYLYDIQSSYIINIHPIIREMVNEDGEEEEIKLKVRHKYPFITTEDLNYYYCKYLYLKKNGFFATLPMEDQFLGKISEQTVLHQIANVDNLVFQVTTMCNLKCIYCCYGELYEDSQQYLNKSLTFQQAKVLLDYLKEKWDSNINISYGNKIMIGFYGGEPLVNFELVSQIVEYTQKMQLKHESVFIYNMTTNAILLDRYMDFLVQHNFGLLISLDGDYIHNWLRIDKKGQASFDKVFKNIKLLQKNHPIYFEKKVNFNSVLNKHSSIKAVHEFIWKEFGKIPNIESISSVKIRKDKIDEYKNIYQPYEEPEELVAVRGNVSALIKNAGFFFYYHMNNSFRHYVDILMKGTGNKYKVPTGTCLPFWKKMFVASTGNIFACERIGSQYVLGKVNEKVEIDSVKIAENYNNYYELIRQKCIHCYQSNACPICLFQLNLENGNFHCPYMKSMEQYKKSLQDIVSLLEENRDLYNRVNKMVFA